VRGAFLGVPFLCPYHKGVTQTGVYQQRGMGGYRKHPNQLE
jgi:hypothetical protein